MGLDEQLADLRANSLDVRGINALFEDVGVAIRVRRAGGMNQDYAIRLVTNTAPYRIALTAETLTDDTADRILARTYAETIVAHWWRPDPASGDPLLICTPDNIEAWLLANPLIFQQIQDVAENEDHYIGDPEPV